jgi:hypothetical protein
MMRGETASREPGTPPHKRPARYVYLRSELLEWLMGR